MTEQPHATNATSLPGSTEPRQDSENTTDPSESWIHGESQVPRIRVVTIVWSVVLLSLCAVMLIPASDVRVNPAYLAIGTLSALGLLVLGLAFRRSRHEERIS